MAVISYTTSYNIITDVFVYTCLKKKRSLSYNRLVTTAYKSALWLFGLTPDC